MEATTEHNRHKAKHTHRVLYKAGQWREWFPEEKFKLIVAMALNDTVVHEEKDWGSFYITGYLITCCRLYLVAKTSRHEWKHIQDFFFHRVRHYIEITMKEEESGCDDTDDHKKGPVLPLHHFIPFTTCPFREGWLLELITGHAVHTGYDDQSLKRLKHWLAKQRFCSVIDHERGEGPVLVKCKHEEV